MQTPLKQPNSFIHTFEVNKDIEKIFVKLPYTTGNIKFMNCCWRL